MVDPPESYAPPGDSDGETGLQELIGGYLRSRSKGDGADSGTYRASAESELRRWQRWMEDRGHGLDDLRDHDRGTKCMRRYAQRLRERAHADDGIAASTAQTYYAYIRACLSWGVRDGMLDRNPALPDRATEELPETTSDRSDQQFWTPQQRKDLLAYVRQEAEVAVDEHGFGLPAVRAARDRALVATLYFAAVRGAEVLRHRQDARAGRQGLRWENVDLDAGRIRILGKGEQETIWHPLPEKAAQHVEQVQRVQQPASEDWPVFQTIHTPSLWSRARKQLESDRDVDALVDELGSVHEVYKAFDVAPPALTTDGARSRLKTLTEQAGIDPGGEADYLQPHGARRGMVGEVWRRDRGEAQDLARHSDMSVTEDAYRHLEAEAQRKRIDDLIDEIG